jgi:hypothetical protein
MVFYTEIPGLEMRLRNQIILVNLGIAAGLGFEMLHGASKIALLIVGVVFYSLVNVIFWSRAKKLR